jgi:aminoglycoside-2''-adenylyltransferase
MLAEEVVDLLDYLEGLGVDLWLDGGWGVDALLETQTRGHDDLDLVVALDQVPRLQAALAERGYLLGGAPMSFEITDDAGRQVDPIPPSSTSAVQLLCHSGYDLDGDDVRDVEAFRERFGLGRDQ